MNTCAICKFQHAISAPCKQVWWICIPVNHTQDLICNIKIVKHMWTKYSYNSSIWGCSMDVWIELSPLLVELLITGKPGIGSWKIYCAPVIWQMTLPPSQWSQIELTKKRDTIFGLRDHWSGEKRSCDKRSGDTWSVRQNIWRQLTWPTISRVWLGFLFRETPDKVRKFGLKWPKYHFPPQIKPRPRVSFDRS